MTLPDKSICPLCNKECDNLKEGYCIRQNHEPVPVHRACFFNLYPTPESIPTLEGEAREADDTEVKFEFISVLNRGEEWLIDIIGDNVYGARNIQTVHISHSQPERLPVELKDAILKLSDGEFMIGRWRGAIAGIATYHQDNLHRHGAVVPFIELPPFGWNGRDPIPKRKLLY